MATSGPPLRKTDGWYTTNGSFVNKLIFPAPEPSYTKTSFPNQLVWVPKRVEDALEFGALRDDQVIPCLLLRNYQRDCNYLMIYLHGNAADLGRCRSLCLAMMKLVGCHVLAVEYPGYGINPGWPNEETVTQCCRDVYDWVVSPYGMQWPPNQIIIMGRSIGSGPAVNLCQQLLKPMPPPPSRSSNFSSNSSIETNESQQQPNTGFWNNVSGIFSANCVNDHASSTSSAVSNSESINPNEEEFPQFPDPFISMPQSDVMIENLLTKAGVPFDPAWSAHRKIHVARKHDLVPPLDVCLRSNKNSTCALLILYAPFESISHVVSSYAGDWASYLVSNRFRSIDKIKNISSPLLIIHSKEDEIIPIEQGENLYREAHKHHLNVRFHRVSGLKHNETNVSRDISKPVHKMLDLQGGEYVRWDPPEMVFREPISLDPLSTNEMLSREMTN